MLFLTGHWRVAYFDPVDFDVGNVRFEYSRDVECATIEVVFHQT